MTNSASGNNSITCGHNSNNLSNPLSGLDEYINLFACFFILSLSLSLSLLLTFKNWFISIPLLIIVILLDSSGYKPLNKFACHSV